MQVRNPRTGEFDYTIYPLSREATTLKAQLLRTKQANWFAKDIMQRIPILQDWKEMLVKCKNELIEALYLDTGRKAESFMEVEEVLESIDRWCDLAFHYTRTLEEQFVSQNNFLRVDTELTPYPVVGVISPCSFPFLIPMRDVIPALLVGSTVLIKPSELTPRFMKVLASSLHFVPELADVVAFIEGDEETGKAMCEVCDFISFTGSLKVAQQVAELTAKAFVPVQINATKKSVAIVTESADWETVTSAILWGSVFNAGQSCSSIEAIYVQRNVFPLFLSRLVGKANLLNLAYPSLDSGQIGPIISETAVQNLNEQLDDAIRKGAKIIAGSTQVEQLGGGNYVRPTILTNVNHRMKLLTEPTFGPLLPVMTFQDVKDPISWVNRYSPSADIALFGEDAEELLEISKKLNVSTVSLNDVGLNMMIGDANFASFKPAGMSDMYLGQQVFRKFLKSKALISNKALGKPAWWYD
ncbi:MAG: aldehyde dehydrogenase family protein [Spirosomataceae bacterium]